MKILGIEKMEDIRVKDKCLHHIKLEPECEADEEWLDKEVSKVPGRSNRIFSVLAIDELSAMSYMLELLTKAKLKCGYC